MAIVADDKDWTWVLDRPCSDCGFVADQVDRAELGARLRANAALWRGLLEHPGATDRPLGDQWSALEYACHVRDVFTIMLGRLELLLAEDDPTFPNWDQDATADADDYSAQDPTEVLGALEVAGEAIAARFDAVSAEAWDRAGSRSDGARFTVDTLGRYLLHDPVHHVWDVTQGYVALG